MYSFITKDKATLLRPLQAVTSEEWAEDVVAMLQFIFVQRFQSGAG